MTATDLFSGAAFLLLAKVVFVVAGYLIFFGLPRILTPDEFGIYLIVNSVVSVLNAVFITGTIQAVSRFVSGEPDRGRAVTSAAFGLQALLAGSVTAIYLLSAPFLALVLNDAELAVYFRVSAVIPLCYAFYAVFIGYLNGSRRFADQAMFDVGFSALKVTLVLSLALLGFGPLGAVAGFALASCAILGLAVLRVRPAASDSGLAFPLSRILSFEVLVLFHVGVSRLLLQTDLLLLKALQPPATANLQSALYGSAVKLAQVPQSIVVALNFLIFPLTARSSARQDALQTAIYVRQGLRVCLLLVAGPSAVIALTSDEIVSFVFGASYVDSGPPLTVLAVGYAMLAVFSMALTMITSSGRPGMSLALAASALVVDVVLNLALIPAFGMMGAAVGTSVTFGIGLSVALVWLWRRFDAALPWATALRVGLIVALLVLVESWMPIQELPVILEVLVLGGTYIALLFAICEIRWVELEGVLQMGTTGPA